MATTEQRRARLYPSAGQSTLDRLRYALHIAKRDLYSKRYKSVQLISSKVSKVQRIESKIKEEMQWN